MNKYIRFALFYIVVVIIVAVAGGFNHTVHNALHAWSWALSAFLLLFWLAGLTNKKIASHPATTIIISLPLIIFFSAFVNNMFLWSLPLGR